jgi:glycosyl transferase family 25
VPFPATIISLSRATDRRAQCASELAAIGLPFEFFDAVEGAELTPIELAAVYDSEANAKGFKRPLSPAEIGCYLSHRAIWRRLAEGDADSALVFEDDLRLLAGAAEAIERLNGFDLSDVMVKLDGVDGGGGEGLDIGGGFRLRQPIIQPPRTTGYVVGREAARRLLVARERFFRPVDIDLKHFWEHRVPILVLAPAIIPHDEHPNAPSSLAEGREGVKPSGKFARLAANVAYQIQFRAGLMRYRREAPAYRLIKKAPATDVQVAARPKG